MDGIAVINKPTGMTSHDVVSVVRRKFNTKRVGHAGTLDPLATGVLIILIGRSTKLFEKFVGFDKAYRATLLLGTKTTTADIKGDILETLPFEDIVQEQVREVFESFMGFQKQCPPMYSAVKFKGRKLYQLARKGIHVERQPREIRIDRLEIVDFSLPYVEFILECSKGTYVRQVAEDAGEKLGCGACICQIERTRVGSFNLDEAVNLEDLNESHIRHWQPQKTL